MVLVNKFFCQMSAFSTFYKKRCCRACRISDSRVSSVESESYVCIKIHSLLHSEYIKSKNKDRTVTC